MKDIVPAKEGLPAERVDLNMDALFEKAVEHDRGIEVIERLVALRREMKAEWARDRYFEALSQLQSECPEIKKEKAVHGNDGKLRYRYAPLEVVLDQVKSVLRSNGFSYVLDAEEQDTNTVTAICRAHHVDGHAEETRFRVPIDEKAYMNAPQKVASALTYAKRYAFLNAFGIMTADQDDDATIAGPPQKSGGLPPCPVCGEDALMVSKKGPGYYCFPKKGGCGLTIAEDQLKDAVDSPPLEEKAPEPSEEPRGEAAPPKKVESPDGDARKASVVAIERLRDDLQDAKNSGLIPEDAMYQTLDAAKQAPNMEQLGKYIEKTRARIDTLRLQEQGKHADKEPIEDARVGEERTDETDTTKPDDDLDLF